MTLFKKLFGDKFTRTEKRIGSWVVIHEKNSDGEEVKHATSFLMEEKEPVIGFQFNRVLPSKEVEFDVLIFSESNPNILGLRSMDMLNGQEIETVVINVTEKITRIRTIKTDSLARALEHAWLVNEIQLGLDCGKNNENGEKLYTGYEYKCQSMEEALNIVNQ